MKNPEIHTIYIPLEPHYHVGDLNGAHLNSAMHSRPQCPASQIVPRPSGFHREEIRESRKGAYIRTYPTNKAKDRTICGMSAMKRQWVNENNAGRSRGNNLQLELPRSRTEVLSISQRLENGASGVNACKGDTVTIPVDFYTLLFQGEEGDHGTNSDGAGEARGCDAEREREFVSMRQAIGRSGGHSLVVLGPPGQETPPDVVVEDESDRNGRPNVGHVVRSPDKSTD